MNSHARDLSKIERTSRFDRAYRSSPVVSCAGQIFLGKRSGVFEQELYPSCGGDVTENNEKLPDEIERLKKDLDTQMHLAEERLDRLKYLQADFDNYRKWSEKEKTAIITMANENLIKDLLVILDDFDQALPSLEQEKNKEGMMMVRKKMLKILKEYGLQPIDCEGKKFDPHFHEVICMEKCDEEQNTILEDLGRGYQLNTKVIRPSKVKIAEHIGKDEGEKNG